MFYFLQNILFSQLVSEINLSYISRKKNNDDDDDGGSNMSIDLLTRKTNEKPGFRKRKIVCL